MEAHRRRFAPGVSLALGAAVLFGLSMPAAKPLLATVDPWLAAGLLYSGAGLGLALVCVLRAAMRSRPAEAPLRRADLPWLIAAVAVGGVLGPVLLMFGLARSDATTASLLLNLEGVATLGIAWLVLGEHVDRRLLLGAGAIVAGAVLLSWQGGATFSAGALLVALACVAWGVDNNLTRKLSSADPAQTAMIKTLAAGGVNLILPLATGAAVPDLASLAALGIIGFLSYGISLVLFVAALRHLGAARTGAYFSLAPFVGAIAGLSLLEEEVRWSLPVAGCLMAAGLYLHLTERHDHEHVHELVEHEHGHVHDEHHQHRHWAGHGIRRQHAHRHRHPVLVHRHRHYPDLHHRHPHPRG